MASVVAKRRFGPATFEVTEAIDGGLLVMVDGVTGKVKKTTGPTVKCLGVNLSPVTPAGTSLEEAGPFNEPIYAMHDYPHEAAIAWTGEFPLTFSANAAFGDLVYPAAAGLVGVDGTGAQRAIGQCVEPAGVVFATDPVGLVRLF